MMRFEQLLFNVSGFYVNDSWCQRDGPDVLVARFVREARGIRKSEMCRGIYRSPS